jgi:hypothetical protein
VGVNNKRFAAFQRTGVFMKGFLGASLSIALAASVVLPAAAASLPEVKVSNTNAVPACATPGRLMAYLRSRNPGMNDRYDGLATEYMRHGEVMGIRWDMAFFQMILETGALRYDGDVRASQNNFAGLGASGGGKHGEHFADISIGVKAHLQHLMMYAGEHIDDPVAERTRKVQEWGVLTKWQNSINGPMTYSLVAQQWAPGSRGYTRDISAISDLFYDSFCSQPDPRPEMVQEARKGRAMPPQTQVAAVAAPATGTAPAETNPSAANASGADIAQRTIENEREDDPPRVGLGASSLADGGSATKSTDTEKVAPAVTLLNPTKPQADKAPPAQTDTAANTATTKSAGSKIAFANAGMTGTAALKPDKTKAAEKAADATKQAVAKQGDEKIQTASVAGAATKLKVPDASKSAAKCKVWTASYGGQRAVLIKAATNGTVNYTVLDVNAASERREVDAYIAAYAKGGERVGAFPSQTKALDKAFQLCPEG